MEVHSQLKILIRLQILETQTRRRRLDIRELDLSQFLHFQIARQYIQIMISKLKIILFHFQIQSKGIEKDEKETLIVLPFIKDADIEKLFDDIKNRISSLNLEEFLFLNNIMELTFSINDVEKKKISKVVEDLTSENCSKVIMKTNEKAASYIVIKHNSNDFIKIAFRIMYDTKHNKEIIIPEDTDKKKNSRVFAFFPTEEVTNLRFLIQGPV